MTNPKTNNDMKKIIVSVCLLLAATAINAQKTCKDGGISATMLQEIVKAQPSSTAEKALANAIAQNKIDDLAKNYRNASGMTTKFNVETPSQSIHDQKSSGRCWMFSGLNVLRANFAAAHDQKQVVDFSQAYLFFYDQLEKANLMLQGSIDNASKPIDDERVQFFFKNPINDGGTFCGVADLAEKYGLVPMQAMPETYNSDNTSRMARIISSKLREYGLELRGMVAAKKKDAAIKQRKTEMLGTIYHILALTLGEPTKEFSYTFRDSKGNAVGEAKTYTPKSFYDATVGSKLNGTFIMVMNDPRRPYHKTYEVDYDRHVYDGHKMYSSYDVGKQLDRKLGYMDLDNYDYGTLFGTTFPMNKADRIATFDSGSTHAMTLTAVNLDANGKPTEWKVENSWGASYGQAGCLIMSNRWFNEYMFRLVVNKKYVPAKLQGEFDQKPVMVMPEDPLFADDL